jgi:hypothetical protein
MRKEKSAEMEGKGFGLKKSRVNFFVSVCCPDFFDGFFHPQA